MRATSLVLALICAPASVALGAPLVRAEPTLAADAARAADPLSKTPDLGPVPPNEETLSNTAGACPDAWIAPLAGEESDLAVARLTPASYPFEVTHVRYALDNSGLKEGRITCSAAYAHEVEIFVDGATRPPEHPQILQRWHVAGVTASQPLVVRSLALEAPVVLEKGQHLFVAVRAAGKYPSTLCMAACGGPSVPKDRNYWGKDGAQASWPMLASFNLAYSFRFEAIGFSRTRRP